MTCTCTRGPDKFEGEPALAALAYNSSLNGCSDHTTGTHPVVDWFSKPFNFEGDHDNSAFASALGYCQGCIDEALHDPSYGLDISTDDQGFVYLHTYATKDEYDAALTAAERGDHPECGCRDCQPEEN